MDIRDIINYAGFFVGILGIALSIYLFRKGVEAKDPRYYYKTFKNISKLSDEEDSKIKITYGQDEVSRVFTTYVWAWNNGKKPINKTDIPPQSNIRIDFHDEKFTPKILDYEIIKASRSEINFSATRSGETALVLNFDFLDQNDGAVLEIQHTGSSETEIKSDGIILGVPEGFKVINTNNKKSAFMRAVLRTNSMFEIRNYTKNPKIFYAFSTIVLIILVGMFGYMFYSINYDPTITTPTSKLKEALLSEFPQASEQNISNVIENINRKKSLLGQYSSQYSNLALVIFVAIYMLVIIGMLVSIARKDVVTPYPKSLNLGDDLLKFSKDR
jgi:hypothetical protein